MFLKPDYNLKDIYEIDFKELKSKGIKAILFDLDSTLMKSKAGEYSEKTLKWLGTFQRDFIVAVISNNFNNQYIEKVQGISTFDVLGACNKPNPKVLLEYLNNAKIKPSEAVMIGDRPLTDILAGKRAGCMTILVGSINAANEGIPTRFVRWLERLSIKH